MSWGAQFAIPQDKSVTNLTDNMTLTPKMFVLGTGNDTVKVYSLSTDWNPSTGTYKSGQDKSVNGQEVTPTALAFKPDGTKMFVVGNGAIVKTYNLSTAWNPSTGTYDSAQDKSVTNEESNPREITFKPDGTKMFVLGSVNDTVKTYNLSTAWDPSTATYDAAQDKSVNGQEVTPTALAFKPDGTKMFVVGNGAIVKTYNLSTAWNPSTGTYDSAQDKSVNVEDFSPQALAFKPDGTKMFIVGQEENTIKTYTLSTAWNPSTGTYDSAQDKSAADEENLCTALVFRTEDTDARLDDFTSPVLDVSGIATVHEANTNTNLDTLRDTIVDNMKDLASKVNAVALVIRRG